MKEFNIYVHKTLKKTKAVKVGWSWPAFIFNYFWGIAKALWKVTSVVTIILLIYAFSYFYFFVQIDNFGQLFPDVMSGLDFFSSLIVGIVFAGYGNQWRVRKLSKLGYKFRERILAKNHRQALAQYKINLEQQLSEDVAEEKYEDLNTKIFELTDE